MDNKLVIYESLLNEIASLEKECFNISAHYYDEFGDELTHLMALKVDSIAIKKKINYCMRKLNHQEEIDFDEMEKEVNKAMKESRRDLANLIAYTKSIEEAKWHSINFDERKKIKNLYYKIVHLIHPDLHPDLFKNKKINNLWQQCVDYYNVNNEKMLKRIYDEVLLIVDKDNPIIVKDIDEKISALEEEIQDIQEREPYIYKYILEDEYQVFSFHKKNDEEIRYYKKYIKKLNKELDGFKKFQKVRFDA